MNDVQKALVACFAVGVTVLACQRGPADTTRLTPASGPQKHIRSAAYVVQPPLLEDASSIGKPFYRPNFNSDIMQIPLHGDSYEVLFDYRYPNPTRMYPPRAPHNLEAALLFFSYFSSQFVDAEGNIRYESARAARYRDPWGDLIEDAYPGLYEMQLYLKNQESIATVESESNDERKKAVFWLNVHNATVIREALTGYEEALYDSETPHGVVTRQIAYSEPVQFLDDFREYSWTVGKHTLNRKDMLQHLASTDANAIFMAVTGSFDNTAMSPKLEQRALGCKPRYSGRDAGHCVIGNLRTYIQDRDMKKQVYQAQFGSNKNLVQSATIQAYANALGGSAKSVVKQLRESAQSQKKTK